MNYTKKDEKSSFDKSKIALKELKLRVEKSKKIDSSPKKRESFFEKFIYFFRRLYEKVFK